ncbi:hypothetical protein [Sanguibacter antarcticus]|uniref:Secreted protein n=1 Tax=Sanguibacter antarcticus TaxID=372484 RepID=A0A2A9E3B2_9MICO|nr:hypothetical protein [Sanguibacter antarcticus]PFG33061.1 hypothetical protein ATL42_0921 [Sanguibacter antarcticus]
MTWSETTILVLIMLALVAWLLWVSASRLDRLHRKVVASRLALDSQLVRRSAAAVDLAASGALDPVSSVLVAEAAHESSVAEDSGGHQLVAAVPDLADLVALTRQDAADHRAPTRKGVSRALGTGFSDDRAQAESILSATLRTVLEDPTEVEELYRSPDGDALLEALAAAWYRVQLARRFHNEAVAQAQRVRSKAVVRAVRLAGHAVMPETVELDDAWPTALRRPGATGGRGASTGTLSA